MKIIKRITAITLALMLSALLIGCSNTEKTLTVYNASDMFLTALLISDSEEFSSDDDVIYIYKSSTAMSPKYSEDIVVEIPEDMLNGELFLYASLTSVEPFKHYEITQPIGTALSEDAWGFAVDFDGENKEIVITVLDDSAV